MDPRIEELHRRAEQAGDDSYTDPASGYEVLTASFLRERGTCCDSGCRHCPYRSEWSGRHIAAAGPGAFVSQVEPASPES